MKIRSKKPGRERSPRVTFTSSENGSHSGVIRLSRHQIVESLEKGARRRTGLSARVMLRRYRGGRLADPCRVIDLVALSNLLRKNDPILVG
jgi:hypothetical protein